MQIAMPPKLLTLLSLLTSLKLLREELKIMVYFRKISQKGGGGAPVLGNIPKKLFSLHSFDSKRHLWLNVWYAYVAFWALEQKKKRVWTDESSGYGRPLRLIWLTDHLWCLKNPYSFLAKKEMAQISANTQNCLKLPSKVIISPFHCSSTKGYHSVHPTFCWNLPSHIGMHATV